MLFKNEQRHALVIDKLLIGSIEYTYYIYSTLNLVHGTYVHEH